MSMCHTLECILHIQLNPYILPLRTRSNMEIDMEVSHLAFFSTIAVVRMKCFCKVAGPWENCLILPGSKERFTLGVVLYSVLQYAKLKSVWGFIISVSKTQNCDYNKSEHQGVPGGLIREREREKAGTGEEAGKKSPWLQWTVDFALQEFNLLAEGAGNYWGILSRREINQFFSKVSPVRIGCKGLWCGGEKVIGGCLHCSDEIMYTLRSILVGMELGEGGTGKVLGMLGWTFIS